MKSVTVAIVCVIVLIKLTTAQPSWMIHIDECQAKTKATDDDVKNVLKVIPKTREAACFLACVKKASGVMDEKNKTNLTKMMETMADIKATNKVLYDKIVKVFEDCIAIQKDEADECVATQKMVECVLPKKIALMKLQ